MFIANSKWSAVRISLALATLSGITACNSFPEIVSLPSPDIEVGQTAAFSPAIPFQAKPGLASFDLSYWDKRTSPRDWPELNMGTCSMIFLEPEVAQGEWRLVGVSEDARYTPILDIYNDRTGNRGSNGTVYYHFKLYPTE